MVDQSSFVLILAAALAVLIWWRWVLWLIALALIALLILGAVEISSMVRTTEVVTTVDTTSHPHLNLYHCGAHRGPCVRISG